MTKSYRFLLYCAALLFSGISQGQVLTPFAGSGTAGKLVQSFYSPVITGNKTFSDGTTWNSGYVQLSADTAAVFDTSILQYDLDSIPAQTVYYDNPCQFYIKSDSLNRIHKAVKGRFYYVTSGTPRGTFTIDRFNLVQYLTTADTLDFEIRFALITTTNDTVKSKTSVHFNIVPTLLNETTSFGVGNNNQLPDPQDKEWQVQTIDSSYSATDSFNHLYGQHLRTISFSGVQVVLEKNSPYNALYLLDKATNIDTLNLYAETLIIRDGFTFPGTVINIYAKELRFEDVNGKRAYLCTTPYTPPTPITNPLIGQKGGDIYLHIQNFSANPAIRFILNGGNGDTSIIPGVPIAPGGIGGNLYAPIDLKAYAVMEGGYSGRIAYQPPVLYKAGSGNFFLLTNPADWLNPRFFSIVVNYYREGFYRGLSSVVAKKFIEYESLIEAYESDGSFNVLNSNMVVEIQQLNDQMNKVLFNIDNDLDYFGNPLGWVPMLSFEVMLSAYSHEVDHAMNILFLDRLIQNANSSLAKRADAFQKLKTERQSIVQDNLDEYKDLTFNVIPGIQSQIDNNNFKSSQLSKQLEDLNNYISAKAAKRYKKQKKWKWVGIASNLLKMIPDPSGTALLASKGLSLAAKLSGKNAKMGFNAGKELTDKIESILLPFTSGSIVGDFANIGQSIDGGVSDIFSSISNMHNANDVLSIIKKGDSLFKYNKNLVDTAYSKLQSVVDLYNKILRVDKGKYGSIRSELAANEPRLNILHEQIAALAQEQQKLSEQLASSHQQMLVSKSNVYDGLTAISNFNNVVFDAAASMDHRLSVFSSDMRRKAFDRLKKYHYYLAKAYEYRTLQPYTTSFDASAIILRIDSLVNSGKTSLSPSDYTSLAAVYKEEIQQIAEDMYTYYNANRPASSIKATYVMKKEDINSLNQNQPVTLNFVQAGLFPASSEDIRIVGLKISKIKTSVDSGTQNGSFNYIDLKMDYPNYSQIKKKGVIYNFNNYNSNTEYPINWTSRYDFFTNTITPSQLSGSDLSLLWYLLTGTAGNPTNTTEFVLYSRPSAWADIKITKEQVTDGDAIAKIDSVFFEVEYDYLTRPSNLVNVQINTNNKWFAPTVNISTTDKYGRKSGIGDVHRCYSLASGTNVTAEVPATYGSYAFQKWVDRFGNNLQPTTGVDVSGGNKIKFSLSTDRSFKAQYKYTGPIFSYTTNAPITYKADTVYLDQALQCVLNIKNIGADTLFWDLDSNSSWIRYSGSRTGYNDTAITLTFDQNPDMLSKRVGVLDVSSTETESLHNYVYFVQGKRNGPLQYMFVGNGNWNNAANWSNEAIPPSSVSENSEVIINPATNGECILNVNQVFKTGTKLTVKQGKKLIVLGKLTIN